MALQVAVSRPTATELQAAGITTVLCLQDASSNLACMHHLESSTLGSHQGPLDELPVRLRSSCRHMWQKGIEARCAPVSSDELQKISRLTDLPTVRKV